MKQPTEIVCQQEMSEREVIEKLDFLIAFFNDFKRLFDKDYGK